ncbi:hypothetical protein GIB67_040410 [Kingdonia uniflora]|uniref:Uncharacterized protein n=1 Tax=Kingdonia uniflora TaxID=39325 RepID=A0A7J7KXJ7_9MAGN|nr:hypothetical protein GIB67_040410 [Kingdonia uniflora]
MSILCVEIFDRHIGDMNFLFGNTTILFRPLDVVLILRLHAAYVHHDFSFADPDQLIDFWRRRFPKIKKSYGINDIKVVKILTR